MNIIRKVRLNRPQFRDTIQRNHLYIYIFIVSRITLPLNRQTYNYTKHIWIGNHQSNLHPI